jgi:hypothetical protein
VRLASAHASQVEVRVLIVWLSLSQHHSTGLPSPKRYGSRYEAKDPGRTSENKMSWELTVLPGKN